MEPLHTPSMPGIERVLARAPSRAPAPRAQHHGVEISDEHAPSTFGVPNTAGTQGTIVTVRWFGPVLPSIAMATATCKLLALRASDDVMTRVMFEALGSEQTLASARDRAGRNDRLDLALLAGAVHFSQAVGTIRRYGADRSTRQLLDRIELKSNLARLVEVASCSINVEDDP